MSCGPAPVTVILAQCDAALGDDSLSSEHRQQIELIEKKARNMAQMISQLLLLPPEQTRDASSFRWKS